LPLTHQRPEEAEGEIVEGITTLIVRALEGTEASQEETGGGGIDINTTKLLAILACMSFFSLLWEQVTSLDGPNAVHETAHDHFISRADDGHTPKAALSTPKWRGESRPLKVPCYNLMTSLFPL